jgi:hypothetical protein
VGEQGRSSWTRWIGTFGLMLAAGLLLVPSSALALETHPLTGSFGPDGTTSTSFASVQGVAVDQASGNVYVYDTGEGGNGKIYKFDSAGNPVDFSSTGTNAIEGVGGSGPGEEELAVAPPGAPGGTTGNIYVAKPSVVLVFAPNGAQVGELTTGGATCGVATDPAGHVFVSDFVSLENPENLVAVREFTPTANAPFAASEGKTSKAKFPGSCNVAVDGLGNFYLPEYSGEVITKFEGIEDETGTLIKPGARTLAIDPASNDLYADRGNVIAQYSSAGTLISISGSGLLSESRGIAVKGGGDIYVGNGATVEIFDSATLKLPDPEAKAPTEVKRTTVTLNGTISAAGGPEADCEFQYTTEGDPNFESATSAPCSPAGPFTGTAVEAVKAEISGLSAQSGYLFRVIGSNENGVNPSEALSFQTRPAVNIKLDPVSNLTPTSATLNGTVNPEGIELEECSFRSTIPGFEAVPVAESPAEIGDGEAPVAVHVDVSALAPNTTYFYLLACKNSLGESESEVASFETFGPPLVSDEFAANLTDFTATLTGRVNPRGLATTYAFEYVSDTDFQIDEYAQATSVPAPPEVVGSGTDKVEVSQPVSGLKSQTTYHFRLVASNSAGSVQGDDAHFTTFISGLPDGLPDGRAYEMVSPPQKKGEVIPPEPVGNLGKSCETPCLPGVNSQGMPMQSTPDGNSILYVGQPFAAGLASGSNEYLSKRESSGWSAPEGLSLPAVTGYYVDFSADLNRSVLSQIEPALSPEAPSKGGESFANLYLRDGSGSLHPLITTPPPNRDAGERAEAFTVIYGGANSGAGVEPAFSHVVFEANDALTDATASTPAAIDGGPGEGDGLYVTDANIYEWVNGKLKLVNVKPGNLTTEPGAVIGSGSQLTKKPAERDVDHAISADGSRIFWSEESTGQTYVRIDGEETVEIPDSAGRFLTAAADGSKVLLSDGRIYGDLEAEPPVEEADLSQGEGGFLGTLGAAEDLSRVYFVDTAALPGAGENQDEEEAQPGAFNLYVWHEGTTTFVGPLLFSDSGDWDASRPSRTAQVSPDGRFLAFMSNTGGSKGLSEVYEYAADSAHLSCVSCNSTDREPLGLSHLSLLKLSPKFPPLRQPQNLSPEGEGRLFFESQDALSPRDTNGRIQDVYQWEPEGIGSCQLSGGCVSLISSGHSPVDSMFLDSSSNGADAFFITREQLLPRDRDEQLDLYDARIGGGFAEETSPICDNPEACLGPLPAVPPAQSAGSASFSGPGNPVHKKHHHKHKKKKHKKHHKHKKHKNHRHGGSK